MISLFIFASLILTFAICAGLSFFLWSARRSVLHKLVMLTQMFYAVWALLIVMTAFAPEFSQKVLLTEVRQLFLPLLGPTWLLVGIGIFYRSFWDRWGVWRNLIYVFPVIVILGHLCSVLGLSFAAKWTFYDFSLSSGGLGLLKYKSGWLINLSFGYIYVCLISLYVLYAFVILMKTGEKRKYAAIMSGAGIACVTLEVLGRLFLDIPEMVQISVVTIGPAALALHYAVTKLELLDIGALAYEKVFESLPSPVLIFDSHENLWNANKAAFEIFGLQASMLGKHKQSLSIFSQILGTDEFAEIKQKNYQVVRHELQLKGGEESASIYVLNDVTDLHERNQTLRDLNAQVLKMMKFNQKIHTVLSHDLTGSLVGVRMLLNGMKQQFEHKHDFTNSSEVEVLIRSNQSSIELLQDVLAWSVERENTLGASLRQCLAEAVSHLGSQLHAKNIRIEQHIPDNEIYLSGSSKVIESIFRNLLSNAIKFSAVGGTVRVEAIFYESQVQVCFIDDGHGISEEKIAMIMAGNAFQENSQTGFGVGLRFTLSFIEQLGGNMQIQSKVGKGSRFTLSLPLV